MIRVSYYVFCCGFLFLLSCASPAYEAMPEKKEYKKGDDVRLVLTGTFSTTGACTPGPMFGMEMERDTGWAIVRQMPLIAMACGFPYMFPDNASVFFFKVGVGDYELGPGEYRILLQEKDHGIVRSESFLIKVE